MEPRVRSLWVLAILLLTAGAWLTVLQLGERQRENDLIRNNKPVVATVWMPGVAREAGRPLNVDGPIIIVFDYQGAPKEVEGTLSERPAKLQSGDTVLIRHDPANPRRWTNRTQPRPVWRDLVAMFILAPAVLGCLAMAWLVRRGILRLWREGTARAAVVVDIRHSALAPLRRLVRCTLRDQRGGRLLSVYVPGGGTLKADEVIWLLTPPDRYDRAIAADMFGGGRE